MGIIFGTGRALINNGPDVISDSSITVKPMPLSGEMWDGYKKTYWTTAFGQQLFNVPRTVTNPKTGDVVNVLCRCRGIREFMQDNNTVWVNILSGRVNPACWEDDSSIMNPNGSDTYSIGYKHTGFYQYSINKDGGIGIIKKMLSGGGMRRTRISRSKTRRGAKRGAVLNGTRRG